MPTFDFHCTACDHIFEFSRPFGSKENPPCPACGSPETEKKIAAPNIQFKGEGFYVTDSAPKQTEQKPAPEPAADKPEPKSDTPKKVDDKPKTPEKQG